MATARLGGFSPQIGFFAFIAGSIGFAVFGSNRFLSCGADSTITPIFAGGLAADGRRRLAGLSGARGGAGADWSASILVVGSLFRLGWIANLLSTPVTVGFLAGISVHILVSQLPGVLGLPHAERADARPHRDAGAASRRGQSLHASASASACSPSSPDRKRISAKIPGALIGLVAATIGGDLGRSRKQGRRRGRHRSGNAADAVVSVICPRAMGAACCRLRFLIAIVVMVQTAATTRSFPSDPDKPADVDRDFLGAGAGSILAGLFGAFPVNASPPRTGIVSETGGRSQLSGLFAAAIVLALLAFGATLLRHVPECGARRRAAVRGAADHPRQADRRRSIASRSASSC